MFSEIAVLFNIIFYVLICFLLAKLIQYGVDFLIISIAFPLKNFSTFRRADFQRLRENNFPLEKLQLFKSKGAFEFGYLAEISDKTYENTIIHFHGNMETIKSAYPFWSAVSKKIRCNIILVEYPGYLEVQQIVFSKEIKRIAYHAYRWVLDTYKKNIWISGTSVGTGIAVWLTKKIEDENNEVSGMILQAPYKSLMKIVFDVFPFSKLDPFQSDNIISDIKCKTLIIHGSMDEVISNEHSKFLWGKLKPNEKHKLEVYDGGHNSLNFNEHVNFLDNFINKD